MECVSAGVKVLLNSTLYSCMMYVERLAKMPQHNNAQRNSAEDETRFARKP